MFRNNIPALSITGLHWVWAILYGRTVIICGLFVISGYAYSLSIAFSDWEEIISKLLATVYWSSSIIYPDAFNSHCIFPLNWNSSSHHRPQVLWILIEYGESCLLAQQVTNEAHTHRLHSKHWLCETLYVSFHCGFSVCLFDFCVSIRMAPQKRLSKILHVKIVRLHASPTRILAVYKISLLLLHRSLIIIHTKYNVYWSIKRY